jgi:hypothetical protein
MTDANPSSGREWSYRFTQPDEVEIATRDLNNDDAAEALARELSKSANTPVTVHRLQRLANSWEYVTEVDERSAQG